MSRSIDSSYKRVKHVFTTGQTAFVGMGSRAAPHGCWFARLVTFAIAYDVLTTPSCIGRFLRAVQVWSLKDVAGPEAVFRDAESFPGPASSAPVERVQEYVEKRAADGGSGEGERLLWSIAGLALQFKVSCWPW